MTRVLVTGAAGFVGRHVVSALRASVHDVHAVTSRAGGSGHRDIGITWHRADLLDRGQMVALLNTVRPDTLLHLAWCAKPPHYWSDLDNVRWTAASLELARAFVAAGGTRIVATGTCAEYDWRFGYCIEGSTPIAPVSLYGSSKAAFGSLLEAFAKTAGIEAAWARLFFLFGPHDAPERLVPSLIHRLHAGEVATCTAGRLVRDYLYVVDAAEALASLAAATVCGAINVASGSPVPIVAIATAVAERIGRPDLLRVADGPMEHPLVSASVRRLEMEVGWRPRYTLADAIDETVRWWTSPERRAALA